MDVKVLVDNRAFNMFTLFATPRSGNCFKPFLLMRQLAIPFEMKVVDVLAGETRGDAFLAVNPAGSVPFLRVAGGEGLGESNAMLWFLAAGSSLIPDEPFEQARGLQWMFFEQSRLEPFISPARFFTAIAPERGVGREGEVEAWRERARAGLSMLERHLASRDFIAGRAYSIADIGVYGYVHVAGDAAIVMADYPSIVRWMARVESTPRYVPLGEMCANGTAFRSRAA